MGIYSFGMAFALFLSNNYEKELLAKR